MLLTALNNTQVYSLKPNVKVGNAMTQKLLMMPIATLCDSGPKKKKTMQKGMEVGDRTINTIGLQSFPKFSKKLLSNFLMAQCSIKMWRGKMMSPDKGTISIKKLIHAWKSHALNHIFLCCSNPAEAGNDSDCKYLVLL